MDIHTLPKHDIVNTDTGEVVDTVDGRDAAFRRQDWLAMNTDGNYHVRPTPKDAA